MFDGRQIWSKKETKAKTQEQDERWQEKFKEGKKGEEKKKRLIQQG